MVAEKVGGGWLYPLLTARAEFRKILMEMGFPGDAQQQVGRVVLLEL